MTIVVTALWKGTNTFVKQKYIFNNYLDVQSYNNARTYVSQSLYIGAHVLKYLNNQSQFYVLS